MNSIENDYRYCRDVIKHHSKSFYYAFKHLPIEDANAVYAIYTFCRMADDIVDQKASVQFRQEQLRNFHKELLLFEQGVVTNEPLWRALEDVRHRYELEFSVFNMQLDGQKMDLSFTQPDSLEDLKQYSLYVAGSVGRMLLPILSEDDSLEMKKSAENLGIAMQITNILRDIGEDFSVHKRIYIPLQIMNEFNYTVSDLKNLYINESFISMWEYLAQYAEMLYDAFYKTIINYKSQARFPLLLSMMVYKEILNEVRKNDYDCLSKRNQVSSIDKHRLKLETLMYLKGK